MMMNDSVSSFIERLKKCPDLDGVRILSSYPCAIKPTQLDRAVIAVGFCDADMSSSGLGEDSRAGCYSVFADIFLPWKKDNSVMGDIFKNICLCVGDMNILSIKADRIAVDKATASFVLKSVFTFNEEIDFGGDDGE